MDALEPFCRTRSSTLLLGDVGGGGFDSGSKIKKEHAGWHDMMTDSGRLWYLFLGKRSEKGVVGNPDRVEIGVDMACIDLQEAISRSCLSCGEVGSDARETRAESDWLDSGGTDPGARVIGTPNEELF